MCMRASRLWCEQSMYLLGPICPVYPGRYNEDGTVADAMFCSSADIQLFRIDHKVCLTSMFRLID
jgi:hypothetical protein